MRLGRFTPELLERYVRQGYWGKPTIAQLWDRNAAQYPDQECVVDGRSRLTWAQARTWIDRVALGLLEVGLHKDDVLIIQLPNISEALLLRQACEKVGIVFVPVVLGLREAELEFVVKTTAARGAVIVPRAGERDFMAAYRSLRADGLQYIFSVGPEAPADTIALDEMDSRPLERKYPAGYLEESRTRWDEIQSLMLTSGTTGFPKICMRGNWQYAYVGEHLTERFRVSPEDRFLAMTTLAGGPALTTCAAAAPYRACPVVLLERWDAEEAMKLIEKERITIAAGVPAQYAMLLQHPALGKYDLSSLRICFYAAANMPYAVAEALEEKLGVRVLTVLGMLDAGIPCSTSWDDPPEVRRTSVGKPFPGNEVKLVEASGREVPQGEIGEIRWRGASSGPGYYRNPEAMAAAWADLPDGWYRTGDLGKQDEEGNLYLVGREKDIIRRSGASIFPAELEALLVTHPKVRSVAIAAMPDPIYGEKVCAFVVPRLGQEFSFEEMVSFLRSKKIASFKLPERLELMEALPYVAGGDRVLRRELTALVTGKLKAEGKL